jgi:hypothetical protein
LIRAARAFDVSITAILRSPPFNDSRYWRWSTPGNATGKLSDDEFLHHCFVSGRFERERVSGALQMTCVEKSVCHRAVRAGCYVPLPR